MPSDHSEALPTTSTLAIAPFADSAAEECSRTNVHLSSFEDANESLSPAALEMISHSLSENSHRAYQSDYRRLIAWGGDFPWSPVRTADYLAAHKSLLQVATLLRHLASIAKAHRVLGITDPTKTEIVRATLRGLRRLHSKPQK